MKGRNASVIALFIIAMMLAPSALSGTPSSSDAASETVVHETIHISYYDQWAFDNDPHVPGLTLDNNVLTMDNVNVSMVHRDLMRAMSINQSEHTLKIVVRGNNVISHVNTTEAEHSYNSCALYSRAPIEIVGEGDNPTLTLNTSDRSNFAFGLLIERTTKISNLKIICNADKSLEKSEAIHSDGTVTMEGVTIEANTGQSKITAGIDAGGVTLDLKDTTISTDVGEASVSSRGIVAGSLVGSNSTVSAIGGKVTGIGDSIGLELDRDDSEIKGLEIVATGGESASKSYGLSFRQQPMNGAISESYVICTGNDSAVVANGSECDRSVFGQDGILDGCTSVGGTDYEIIGSGPIGLEYRKVRFDARSDVTYVSEGSTGDVPVQEPVLSGFSFTVAEVTGLSKPGYTFGGWTDGKRTYFPGESYAVDGDVTLTAIWNEIKENMSVTADSAGRALVIVPDDDTVITLEITTGDSSIHFGQASVDKMKGKVLKASLVRTDTDVYEITTKVDGEEFNGKMTISLHYDSGKGNPAVYYRNGTVDERMSTHYDKDTGTVWFETDHNSTYVVKYSAESSSGTDVGLIIVMIIAIIALAAIIAYAYRRKDC